jgi:hypothetical protein
MNLSSWLETSLSSFGIAGRVTPAVLEPIRLASAIEGGNAGGTPSVGSVSPPAIRLTFHQPSAVTL